MDPEDDLHLLTVTTVQLASQPAGSQCAGAAAVAARCLLTATTVKLAS